MPQFIPMLPSILEPSGLVRNLPPHKQITKNLTILQTNRLSNPSPAKIARKVSSVKSAVNFRKV